MRLGDNGFYNLFLRLVTATNPNRDCDEWNYEGVQWWRSRHIHWSPLSFQIETYRLFHVMRPRWSLHFVHETWWGENRSKTIRNSHWTHLASGDRCDVLRWFATRQDELDRL